VPHRAPALSAHMENMRLFDRFRATPPTEPASTEATPAKAVSARPVADGLTVEMKLRGRLPDDQGGLQAAENRLAELQTLYRQGGYSGHPEEMLEDIEYAEREVERLRAS
jgi:hypothetical protein